MTPARVSPHLQQLRVELGAEAERQDRVVEVHLRDLRRGAGGQAGGQAGKRSGGEAGRAATVQRVHLELGALGHQVDQTLHAVLDSLGRDAEFLCARNGRPRRALR